MPANKKIYFASDFHLGVDYKKNSQEREIMLVNWLESIKNTAEEIYLMGDIFDYWFEYKEVVPRGFVMLLGKLKQLRLEGIPIFLFIGNHDMWIFDYFEKELDIPTFRKPIVKKLLGKKFYLAHGDGLGNVPFREKLMKRAFSNYILQWLFARIHPNTGIAIMKYFSNASRMSHSEEEKSYMEGKEYLEYFAEQYTKNDNYVDYFVFGHRHIVLKKILSNGKSTLINLGDWISHFSYGVFDGTTFEILKYENK